MAASQQTLKWSVMCPKCGATMQKMNFQEAYNDPNIRISCDECRHRVSGKQIMFHCPNNLNIFHRKDFNYCSNCAEQHCDDDIIGNQRRMKWQWHDGQSFVDYDEKHSMEIEEAYKYNKNIYRFQDNKDKSHYSIIFGTMTQKNDETDIERYIRRVPMFVKGAKSQTLQLNYKSYHETQNGTPFGMDNIGNMIENVQILNYDMNVSTVSSTELVVHGNNNKNSNKYNKSYIVSNVDEELLILIEFKHFMDLYSLKIYSLDMDGDIDDISAPKGVHIYKINNLNINFEDIKSLKPDESMECTLKRLRKGQRINLRKNVKNRMKFQNVKYLAIYIDTNQNNTDRTYINSITFNGKINNNQTIISPTLQAIFTQKFFGDNASKQMEKRQYNEYIAKIHEEILEISFASHATFEWMKKNCQSHGDDVEGKHMRINLDQFDPETLRKLEENLKDLQGINNKLNDSIQEWSEMIQNYNKDIYKANAYQPGVCLPHTNTETKYFTNNNETETSNITPTTSPSKQAKNKISIEMQIAEEIESIKSNPTQSRALLYKLAKQSYQTRGSPVIINSNDINQNNFHHQNASLPLTLAMDKDFQTFDVNYFQQDFSDKFNIPTDCIEIISVRAGSTIINMKINTNANQPHLSVANIIETISSSKAQKTFTDSKVFCVEIHPLITRIAEVKQENDIDEMINILNVDAFPKLTSYFSDKGRQNPLREYQENIIAYFRENKLNKNVFSSTKRENFVSNLCTFIGSNTNLKGATRRLYTVIEGQLQLISLLENPVVAGNDANINDHIPHDVEEEKYSLNERDSPKHINSMQIKRSVSTEITESSGDDYAALNSNDFDFDDFASQLHTMLNEQWNQLNLEKSRIIILTKNLAEINSNKPIITNFTDPPPSASGSSNNTSNNNNNGNEQNNNSNDNNDDQQPQENNNHSNNNNNASNGNKKNSNNGDDGNNNNEEKKESAELDQSPCKRSECLKNVWIISQQNQLIKMYVNSNVTLLDSKKILLSQIEQLIKEKSAKFMYNHYVQDSDKGNQTKQSKKKRKKQKNNVTLMAYNPLQGCIQIPRDFTSTIIPSIIKENIVDLFNYMSKWAAVSIHDNYSMIHNKKYGIMIINYDFHDKKTNETLYCVVEWQDPNLKENRGYQWKMQNKLYTEKEVSIQLKMTKLPISSRYHSTFKSQLENGNIIKTMLRNTDIGQKIIHNTPWTKINVFTKLENRKRMTLLIEKDAFIQRCKELINDNIDLIPIIMFDNDNNDNNKRKKHKYWRIEFVWIIKILIDKNIDIGISLRYTGNKNNCIEATGIHLTKKYVYDQHMMIDPEHECKCFDKCFESTINDIKIGNPNTDQNIIKSYQYENEKLMDKNKQLSDKNTILSELLTRPDKLFNNLLFPNTSTQSTINCNTSFPSQSHQYYQQRL